MAPLEKQSAMTVKCPACSHDATMTMIVHEVDWFGKLLLSTLKCASCGFKWNDVSPTDLDKKPTSYQVGIEKPSDLSIKVIKSSSSTIKIPEAGVEIEPGPASDGYFTNIEGLLNRVLEVVGQLVRGAENPAEKKAALERFQLLSECLKGKHFFTVEILDPFGNGLLVGNHVKKTELSEKEAAKLKQPLMILGN